MRPDDADDLLWDDANEAHLARRGITPAEVMEVWADDPVFAPNKKGLAATWLMVGRTAGGWALTVAVICVQPLRLLRPITGWDSTAGELTRWGGRRR